MIDAEYVTAGVVTKGKLKVQDQRSFNTALARFPDGLVSVTIATTTEKAVRSRQQNNRQWAIFTQIATECGHTKEEIHDWCCAQFLTYQLDTVDRHTGEVTSVQVTKGTSRLTSKEHSYFMQQVELWAGETFGMTFEAVA